MTDAEKATLKRLAFVPSPVDPLRWVRYRRVDSGTSGTNLFAEVWVQWEGGEWKLFYWAKADRCARQADVLNGVHPTMGLLLMHAEIDGVFSDLP